MTDRTAKELLRDMVEAIESTRSKDKCHFVPELVFDRLPDGWLTAARKALGEPEDG